MEAYLAEKVGIKAAIVPVDANTAAITGDRISVAKGDRVAVVLNFGASTGAVVNINLKQHTAASAGTSAALSVANPYYKKINTATQFTKVEPVAAASAYDLSTDLAASKGIVVFEVLSEQLDNENGFSYFSVDLDDSTAAKLVSGSYYITNLRHVPAYNTDL